MRGGGVEDGKRLPGRQPRTADDGLQGRGVGCLDCAKEVEEAIAHLRGVEEADFNPIAGRLAVSGEADLTAIQKIAGSEGWSVRPAGLARGSVRK